MGVKWTREQEQVIRLRDRNLLVSAAAGSGKTAVLVGHGGAAGGRKTCRCGGLRCRAAARGRSAGVAAWQR